jgi:hypothetical protein
VRKPVIIILDIVNHLHGFPNTAFRKIDLFPSSGSGGGGCLDSAGPLGQTSSSVLGF